MDREQLADFLRRRREAIHPEDVGLARGTRRRARGLRREEVAMLCDMSVDYYSRLEQRRSAQPSEQILATIARGLRLSIDERDHLFRLAGHRPPPRVFGDSHIAPGLMRLLDRLPDTPAGVLSGFGDVLLQTNAARALFGNETTLTGLSRNVAYRWFTDPVARDPYPADTRDEQSRLLTADLRSAFAKHGSSSRAGTVVAALLAESPEFAELWSRHDVATIQPHEKRLQHPEVGEMTLHCQMLHDHEQGQTLILFTATPGSDSYQKLELLSVIGNERLHPENRS